MNRMRRLLALALTPLVLAGCGAARRSDSGSDKPDFVVAADRICTAHLGTVLAWLRRPGTGDTWHRLAVQSDGIYRIIGRTINRLKALGPAPGPDAAAFTGYVTTLGTRAVLYRLTSTAATHRNRQSAQRLQRRIDAIKDIGDGDAHRYGLQICGTGPRDLAKMLAAKGPVE